MIKSLLGMVAVGVLLLGGGFALYGSDNPWIQDYAIESTQGFTSDYLEPTHTVGRFQFPLLSEQDTFATYVYTYGDIVIFSYEDSSEFEVVDSEGNTVWSDTLMEDEYEFIGELAWGVYMITSPKGFSVLSGDPFVLGLGTWYAVDENSRPVSTKLLSVGPMVTGSPEYEAVLVVFAYNDNTHVVVTDKENDQIIWEGDLDSAEYYLRDGGDPTPIAYSVESSRPVSTMTACGVNGMYVPAFNGTFTGRDFMTYEHQWSTVPQDINLVPWEDETWVTMTDLLTGDTIRRVFCENRGEIKGFAVQLPSGGRPLYIHADKDISVSQTEWASFGTNWVSFYMVRGIDRDGLGLGREFYIPLQASVSFSDPFIYSRLHVIAFSDSTDFVVNRIPPWGGDETRIYEGTLNRGDFYRYTCPLDDSTAVAIYHVTATERVATVASCNDRQGSDFFPVVNLPALGISEEPPATPVTHPSIWHVLNPVGQRIVLQYSDCPHGFHASVFDAAGRSVDELHSSEQSGMIIWGQCYGPGVYFIRADNETGYTQKVVLVK